jgi:two-component system, chemotaxis family, chemotaxis protein CheY
MEEKRLNKPTFLIVDEAPNSRRLVRTYLKKLGFQEVVEASSAADALETIKNKTVDFIISDREMADLPGHELCRQVRAEAGYEQVPFVLLAPQNHAPSSTENHDAGISAYLPEPVQLSSLEAKVQEVLERSIGSGVC